MWPFTCRRKTLATVPEERTLQVGEADKTAGNSAGETEKQGGTRHRRRHELRDRDRGDRGEKRRTPNLYEERRWSEVSGVYDLTSEAPSFRGL